MPLPVVSVQYLCFLLSAKETTAQGNFRQCTLHFLIPILSPVTFDVIRLVSVSIENPTSHKHVVENDKRLLTLFWNHRVFFLD
jgi:hypothetical protein